MAVARKPRSVDEHSQVVAALLTATPVIRLPLVECAGLALAEPITASLPLPPHSCAAVAGPPPCCNRHWPSPAQH